jgi:uroporphyrinogen decarboxylase
MNKKERVDAALRGEPVDRVPASVWGHDYAREGSAQALAEATIENFSRYNWDYVNVVPRASYHVEGWKVKMRPAEEKYQEPVFEEIPIKIMSDWKRLRPLDPDRGVLGEQLHALQLINHGVGYDAYFLQTIFCPLGVAQYLIGNDTTRMLHMLREDRSAIHAALRTITETFTSFAIACLEEGASGIFYSTCGWASKGKLTQDQYREFGEQYDLEFLDAIKSRTKCNVLHIGGSSIYFDSFSDYPVQAISWAASAEGNPDLHEGKLRIGKAVMGGLSDATLKNGPADRVQEEVGKAIELTGGRHFLLGPENGAPAGTPSKHITAIRRVLS